MAAARVGRPRLASTMWIVLALGLSAATWAGIVVLAEYLIDRAP